MNNYINKDKLFIISLLLIAGSVLWCWYSFCIWMAFILGRTYYPVSLSLTQDFNIYGEMILELFFIPIFSVFLFISNIYLICNLKKLREKIDD